MPLSSISLPLPFFDSLALLLLAKVSSPQRRKLQRTNVRADEGACQPYPQPARHGHSGEGCGRFQRVKVDKSSMFSVCMGPTMPQFMERAHGQFQR